MIIAYTLPLPKYDNFDNNIFNMGNHEGRHIL